MLGRKNLILALVAFVLSGCVGRTMNILQGDFDVSNAPVIRGAEFNMDSNSNKRRAHLEIRDPRNQETRLWNVWNERNQDDHLPKVRADINYVFTSFPVAFDLEWFFKKELMYTSFGFGLDPMPYGKASVGVNGSVGEVGASLFWGADFNYASFENEKYYDGTMFMGPSEEPSDEIEWTKDRYFSFRVGAGAYASLFIGSFALTYAPSVSFPWFLKSYFDSNYEISMSFPSFFTNYFGMTYTYHKQIQASVGVSVVNGMKLGNRLYIASTSVSYLF